MITIRHALQLAIALLTSAAATSFAADTGPIKIGLILPMTGQSASTGRQIDAAVKLWMAQNGNKIAGRSVEVILKDDGAVPDATKRIAQASASRRPRSRPRRWPHRARRRWS